MIDKVRVHEIAKELGIASKDVIKKASEIGIDAKSAQSTVSMEEADQLMNFIMNGESPLIPSKQAEKTTEKASSDTQSPKDTPATKSAPIEEKKKEAAKAESAVKEKPKAVAEASKEEEPKEEANETPSQQEDTSVIGQVKKSGLKIVKKKVLKEEPRSFAEETPKKQQTLSSYGKMSAEALEELARKKKAKQSATPYRKKTKGSNSIFSVIRYTRSLWIWTMSKLRLSTLMISK